jgi:hypothetical protein
VLAGAAVVVIGGGAVGALAVLDATGSEKGDTVDSQPRVATVERTALAQGTVLSGTLSRGTTLPLNANGGGVLTWLPQQGNLLEPGRRLFESNGRPTFLLRGKVPLWRPLQLGSRGKDVRSLNEALAAAGILDKSRVDDIFGAGTSTAIGQLFRDASYETPSETDEGRERITQAESARRDAEHALQAAIDSLEESSRSVDTGSTDASSGDQSKALDVSAEEDAVEAAEKRLAHAEEDADIARAERIGPDDVVILDVPEMLVSSVLVRVGDPAAGTVLEWTGTQVHVEADVTRSQQASLQVDDRVTVTLPDRSVIDGTIASTGGSAPSSSSVGDGEGPEGAGAGSGAAPGGEGDTVKLRVELDGQQNVADLVGAAVRIEVTAASVDDALVVPVTALIALAEGGYAVEKVTPDSAPGTGTLVPVEVGLVAEAKVQISSSDLREGDQVITP